MEQFSSGGEYRGFFVAGLAEGKGILIRPGSYRYEGDFVAGRMEGDGRFEFEDGRYYEVDFENDDWQGSGFYSDGQLIYRRGV